MTLRPRSAALLALLVALGTAAQAAEPPRPLSFISGLSRYEVPENGFDSIEFKPDRGLELCMTDPIEEDVAEFTRTNVGAVVRITIGETEITRVQIVEPYDGGCITWPIHPMVAANYIAMLTGEAPRTPMPATGTGE